MKALCVGSYANDQTGRVECRFHATSTGQGPDTQSYIDFRYSSLVVGSASGIFSDVRQA